MKNKTLTSVAGLMALAFSVPTAAVDLCHVANAGFLIKGETASVIIDGLMQEDHYDGRFALPSDTMVGAMMNQTGDFDNLRLVLSTHRHGIISTRKQPSGICAKPPT